jgi:hypothetical protein
MASDPLSSLPFTPLFFLRALRVLRGDFNSRIQPSAIQPSALNLQLFRFQFSAFQLFSFSLQLPNSRLV